MNLGHPFHGHVLGDLLLDVRAIAQQGGEIALQIARAIEDISALLRGEKKSLRAVQLDMSRVPAFNARVYETARAIPPGTTRTYGDIARAVAAPAQAVGQACGANPLPILIPCHRVLGAKGLGGFSAKGGVETKVWLLRHEGAAGLLI